jgi:hypothetical protein
MSVYAKPAASPSAALQLFAQLRTRLTAWQPTGRPWG